MPRNVVQHRKSRCRVNGQLSYRSILDASAMHWRESLDGQPAALGGRGTLVDPILDETQPKVVSKRNLTSSTTPEESRHRGHVDHNVAIRN